ncbi:2-oxo-4-hydroxy-4-carboxy-5-ureidoimidazoline decarboxylase [Allostreptomyces psammosilenae]|uniref:2-oxo-4-hydroxy-4-carboxy-5-ureidoimidazoline decarboxylase n=1 Tax=Allostreptomyces psammosilenae TaxID=1892865 RepID=A0A853AC99_9ACTN|nr:2-oxo-4-hydroxy-4-carboxy-5-ureidoimidazoline decarboxylase [Allostreptomyces psammosilenae]NYI07992.1 2-oxo-4-hydroxy-4-carboxy-5-ureidoimidazoline decarboxylase [Allostreptomyces psammosilenae]
MPTHEAAPARVTVMPGHRRGVPGATEGLRRLNAATVGAAEEALLACCGARRWAWRLARHRPYPDLASLLAAADEASWDLTPEDLHEAFSDEAPPYPLGESGAGGNAGGALTALRAAHTAYQERFGHPFVICWEDRAEDERLAHLLDRLHARLGNDPEEERLIAAEELRRCALIRLTHLVSAAGQRTVYAR